MKTIKKVIFISILLIISILPSVKANEIIGSAVWSDIVCYINNFPITSCNYNGSTYVQVEDLSNYGFDIKWNEYNRTLRIYRNNNNDLDYTYAFRFDSKYTGVPVIKFLKSDVKTYIGDYLYQIESYTTDNGETYICIDNLSAFGKITWSAENRTLNLWIEDGLEMNPEPQFVPYFQAYDIADECRCPYFNYYITDIYGLDDKIWIFFSLINTDENGNITEICNSDGNLNINIIDSWGQSVYNNTFFLKRGDYVNPQNNNVYLSLFAYAHGLTDVPETYFISIDRKDLNADYNKDGNVLIKYSYRCPIFACNHQATFEEKENIATVSQ